VYANVSVSNKPDAGADRSIDARPMRLPVGFAVDVPAHSAGYRRFLDRRDAGRLLAQEIRDAGVLDTQAEEVVVIGLACGGVQVAAEVASALGAALDALAVRKVGHPWQPEYGIVAVAPGGVSWIRADEGLTGEEVAEAAARAAEAADALDARLHERCPRLRRPAAR